MTQLAPETNRFVRVQSLRQRKRYPNLGLIAKRTPRLGRRYGGWAGLALLAALVDSKVLLAGMAGLGAYQLATQDNTLLWQQLCATLEDLKTQLRDGKVRAGLISGAAFMATYGAIAASSHLGSAATLGLLTLGSINLATLVIVIHRLGSASKSDASPQEMAFEDSGDAGSAEADSVDTHWRHLTASHPLKRFVAVRELTAWGLALAARERTDAVEESGQSLGHQGDRKYLVDCFHLMLSQEQEPTIRTALRESLQRLSPTHLPQLGPGKAALPALETKMQPVELAPALLPQRQVDYVEP